MKSKTNGLSNQLDVEIGDHTLTSVSAWRDYSYRPDHDSDLSPFSILKAGRSEEHTSELQSLMRISYAVFCLKKKTNKSKTRTTKSQYNTKQAMLNKHTDAHYHHQTE